MNCKVFGEELPWQWHFTIVELAILIKPSEPSTFDYTQSPYTDQAKGSERSSHPFSDEVPSERRASPDISQPSEHPYTFKGTKLERPDETSSNALPQGEEGLPDSSNEQKTVPVISESHERHASGALSNFIPDLVPATDLARATKQPNDSAIPTTIPIITLQRPSREPSETVPSDKEPTPANEQDAEEAPIEIPRAAERIRDDSTAPVTIIPRPTNTELETSLIPMRINRRKMALRKVRNVAARRRLLNATLGRQLAQPTKEALQRLAKGEEVTIADIRVLV